MSRYFVHSVCTQVYAVPYSLLYTLGLISFYGFLIGLFDLNSNIGSMAGRQHIFTFVLNCIFCCAFTIVRELALVLELPRRNF